MPQYQGVWNLAQQAQALTQQQWVTDPLFDYTTLLLQADNAANGAQNNTFLDSSSNAFAITRNGNTTQGSFSPFSQQPGYWGVYFGGSGNYAVSNAAVIASNTSTFTIEGWIYQTAVSVSGSDTPSIIGDMTPAAGLDYWSFGTIASGQLVFYWYDGNSKLVYTNGTVPLNTWAHIAVSVNANSINMYINGVQQTLTGTTTLTNRSGSTSAVAFAQFSSGTSSLYTGYISNFSVLSGTAKYSGSFTPSPIPLPTGTTNQTLLFAAGNRFADFNTATTAKTFTITGSATSIQVFSPFAPQYQYTPTVTGGSGYFDGTGDYLTIPNSANYSLPGDYTIEAWVYPAVTGGLQRIFMMGDYRSTFNGIDIYTNGSSQVIFYSNGASIITGGTLPAFAWSHIALVRSGSGANNTTLYLNGVSIGQATNTTSFSGVSANGVSIGYEYSGTGTSITTACYMSSIRVVKGQALTSGTFTLPTAPVTTSTVGWTGANAASSLTGTVQLLLNFTNAGILDGTMKNNLETVGNAQVSTSVVKYGSGSISLDGSGDYVVEPTNVNFGYGTGDFTIEFWLYVSSFANDQTVFSNLTSASSTNPHIYIDTPANVIKYYTANADRITGSVLNTGQWYHIAVCRSNANTRLFINGVQSGSTYADTNDYGTSAPLGIGTYWTAGAPFTTSTLNGYMDDIRVTKGIARYTRNFTPPQVALPRQ